MSSMRSIRPRDADHADAPDRPDVAVPVPLRQPAARVLALQSQVGNRAVTAMLARDPAVVDPLSPVVTSAEPYMRQLESATAPEVARAHRQLKAAPDASGKVSVDLPLGCYLLDAAVAGQLRSRALERKEKIFSDFATRRAPLQAAMMAATDPTARHAAAGALRAYDEPNLLTLRAVQKELGGIWEIVDAASRDAVLAAIQLEAATDAQGDLLTNSETVHKRVTKSAGMGAKDEWCGFFVQDNFQNATLDSDLRKGFFHTDNVQDYFQYVYARNPDRIMKWIWADASWQELHAYHLSRGAERRWLDYATLSAGGSLDIRPGDIALIDRGLDGTPNHIVMVQSYDPMTSTLVSVGGNDGGLVIDNDPKHAAPAGESSAAKSSREMREAATGENLKAGPGPGHVGISAHEVAASGKSRGAIFGIGRPSIVDFEEHRYDGNLKKAPAPLKQ
jgi:hypothetical protein